MKNLKYLFFIIFACLISSCITEDYTKFDSSVVYRPNFSIPMGLLTTVLPQPPSIVPPVSITIQDTISYSFENLFKNPDEIESIMFRVQSTNSYPATAIVQAYYYNSNNELLGSLTKDKPLEIYCQSINSESGTTNAGVSSGDYYFTKAEFESLQWATKVIIVTELQNIILSQPLLNNWSQFNVVTTVGLQVQINRQS